MMGFIESSADHKLIISIFSKIIPDYLIFLTMIGDSSRVLISLHKMLIVVRIEKMGNRILSIHNEHS